MSEKPAEAGEAPSSSRRLFVLLLLCVVAVGVAIIIRWQTAAREKAESSVEARLRGSADDAVAALAEQLAVTPPEQRVVLLTRYASDASPNLRYAAVDGLRELRRPETADTIERAFQDNSSLVRQRAAEVLHEVSPERGIHLLRVALRDEDRWVRESAAMQLMVVLRKEKGFFPLIAASLIEAMDPEDEVVCRTSVALLARETGKPWRLRTGMSREETLGIVQRWRAWWEKEKRKVPDASLLAVPEPIRPQRRDPAPDFAVKDLDGRTWTLAGQRGRLTMLHFWGSWCLACRGEMEDLARLDAAYRRRGLDILGVALQDTAEHVRRYAAERRARFAQALGTRKLTDAYGHIHEVPVSILIDRAGMIRYRWEGDRDYNTFEAAVKRLLGENEPPGR